MSKRYKKASESSESLKDWYPSEKDLILARAGHFNEDCANMTICQRHGAELGVLWRPSRKYEHPLHGNRKGKPERGANLEMSRQIMENWRVLIPFGAGQTSDWSGGSVKPLLRVGLRKAKTAVDVCSKLRTLRDESGEKVFNKEDWLNAEQIARYFSRLSVLHRTGQLAIDQADPSSTEEEEEDFVAEAEEIVTRLRVRSQLEL
ncbi:hypothetical protein ACROYT_G030888 [Oculina patagonica]